MTDMALIDRFRAEMKALGARFIIDTKCDRFRDPDLVQARNVWRSRCGAGGIPKHHDLPPKVMRPFLKKVAIFERVAAPSGHHRYRARLTGQEFTLAYDEMSGRFLDEVLSQKYLARWTKIVDVVLAWGRPVRYLTVTEAFGRGHSVLEHFIAPLLDDAGAATHLLFVCNFERRCEWDTVVADESRPWDDAPPSKVVSLPSEPPKAPSLNVADALHAHSRCKAHLLEMLKQGRGAASDHRDFAVDPDCTLVRFIQQHEGVDAYEPELSRLKIAHAAVHSVVIDLVGLRAAGKPIDIENEFAQHGNFGAASSSLLSAIWRLETKLGSLST